MHYVEAAIPVITRSSTPVVISCIRKIGYVLLGAAALYGIAAVARS